jgi:hypothetical protein
VGFILLTPKVGDGRLGARHRGAAAHASIEAMHGKTLHCRHAE